MNGIFGNLFDLNGDGEMSAFELGVDFALFSMIMDDEDDDEDEYSDSDD